MTRLTRGVLAAVLLGAAGSCSSGSGPVAGTLMVSLRTPNPGADGAILLTVSGPQALTSVAPATGLRVFSQSLSTTTKFAIIGPLTAGPVLTIGVTDVGQAAQYHATVQGVAASADFQLRSLAGYSLSVSR